MTTKILLVQPDMQSAQTLTRLFKERGDEVWHAWNLGQAIGLLEQVKPTLMVMDLHYPGDEWLSFLRQVRRMIPKLKIIGTNQYPDLQRELLAREYGVKDILRQPFDNRWLNRTIQALESDQALRPVREPGWHPAPSVRVPVRMKITLPYLILALLFALGGAYVVSQVLLSSVEERFYNELISSGKQSADWLVREENRLLATLRLVSNTQGVADLVSARDVEALRKLVLPLAVNNHEEDIEILDSQGNGLLALRLEAGGQAGDYSFSSGETAFQKVDFVQAVVQGKSDAKGDKFSGYLSAGWGDYFYASGPILDSGGSVVGVVLVGKSLSTLAHQIRADLLAGATFYDASGQPLSSSLFSEKESFPVARDQARQVLADQDRSSQTRGLVVSGLNYTELLAPWEARDGTDLGLIGVALAQTALVSTSQITRIEIFVLVAVAILLVIAVGIYLASLITSPLQRLAKASSEVAEGNLEVKVDLKGDDEVAVLAHSFNHMLAGLQEGSIYRDLLGRTVSPEVREQLRQTFTSGDIHLEGQEAVATVLMTDIRGFTTLSERVDPARIFEWLNEYFGCLVPVIAAHGGVVNKFDGDAMLAFFGILPKPLPAQQSALDACEAALEMVEELDKLNSTRGARGEPALLTGIGINTGPVMAGGLGTSDRLHYTIIGDTVNTTQRLESLTRTLLKNSGVLVGHSTYEALNGNQASYNLEPMGAFAVKGKVERIMVYRLMPLQVMAKLEVML
jgi:class 3 adenylate cyclase/CheY-like chemotaxis protein